MHLSLDSILIKHLKKTDFYPNSIQLNGFFRGMAFPMLSSGILNSILFGVYGNELRRLQNICTTNAERRDEWAQNVFLAGSTAGLIHAFFACPIELVKIRLQTQNRKIFLHILFFDAFKNSFFDISFSIFIHLTTQQQH